MAVLYCILYPHVVRTWCTNNGDTFVTVRDTQSLLTKKNQTKQHGVWRGKVTDNSFSFVLTEITVTTEGASGWKKERGRGRAVTRWRQAALDCGTRLARTAIFSLWLSVTKTTNKQQAARSFCPECVSCCWFSLEHTPEDGQGWRFRVNVLRIKERRRRAVREREREPAVRSSVWDAAAAQRRLSLQHRLAPFYFGLKRIYLVI